MKTSIPESNLLDNLQSFDQKQERKLHIEESGPKPRLRTSCIPDHELGPSRKESSTGVAFDH